MPNWTFSELWIEAPKSDLEEFVAKAEDGLLNAMRPLDEDATMEDAIELWGTKWEAQNVFITPFEDELKIEFRTPWTAPFEALSALKEANPQWNIWMNYTDEDGEMGEWDNGVLEEMGTMYD